MNQKDRFMALYGGEEHIQSVIKNNSKWQDAAYLLQNNKSITSCHLDHFLSHPNENVRIHAADHDNITSKQIHATLNDDNSDVRQAAIENPNAKPEHIESAMSDMNSDVKTAIVRSKLTSNEQLMRIAKDQSHDYNVRRHATDKLAQRLGM